MNLCVPLSLLGNISEDVRVAKKKSWRRCFLCDLCHVKIL
jgi:hypothetical protein